MRGIMVAAFTAASVAGCAGTGQLPADTEATDFFAQSRGLPQRRHSLPPLDETAPEQTAAAAIAR